MLYLLRRKVHISYVIAFSCAGFLAGVFIAQFLGISVLFGLAGLVFAGLGVWKREYAYIPVVILGASLLGMWRGTDFVGQLDQYYAFYGQEIQTRGVVSDDVMSDPSGLRQFPVKSVTIEGIRLPGKLQVSISGGPTIRRGDTVIIKGTLDKGFSTYAGSLLRARLMSHTPAGDPAVAFRDWFVAAVRKTIKEPEASLGVGFLVGQKTALPPDLMSAMQVAGLTHIVVASGYNLTILVRLSRRLLMKVSKYAAMAGSIGLVACFIVVTGLSPSMTRAGLVTALGLATWYYGRKFHPLVLLPFAAMVTVIWNPQFLWDDMGWLLSFTAFAGVMIVAPLLQRYFFDTKKPGTIRQILGETVAAHLMTAPIIIAGFSQISHVAIISNVLILPFVPAAMLSTFIAGVGALLVPISQPIVGLPAQWLLQYITMVTRYLSELPWAQSELVLPTGTLVGAYIIIIAICVYLWRVTKLDLREANIIE